MADLADVELALKAIALGAVYPNGTAAPSAVKVGGAPFGVAVMRGWPTKPQLEADLAAGVQVVSIYTPPQSLRNTTRSPSAWFDLTNPEPTVQAAVDLPAGAVTLSGYVETPQNIALQVNGKTYIYAMQQEDTLANVATGLAMLIGEDLQAESEEGVISITGAYAISARVGLEGTVQRVLRQQQQLFHVVIWCSTPDHRDVLSAHIDGAFAGVGLANPRSFIAMPDTSLARLYYRGTRESDLAELQGVFRRELVYEIEYATTETVAATPVIATEVESL